MCRQALLYLLFGGFAVVLDVAVLQRTIEALEIQKRGNVGMGGRAVVAFVEVVGENFPVVGSIELVFVIEDVFREIDAFISASSV